jgi:integrase
MQLTPLARHASHVIPVTSSAPNRHTRTRIRVAGACRDQGSPIATRIPLNTGFAKTRHSAALRMSRDESLTMRDVQTILGHAHLSTTADVYLVEDEAEVIRRVRQHLAAREQRVQQSAPPPAAAGYDAGDLSVLFGGTPQ